MNTQPQDDIDADEAKFQNLIMQAPVLMAIYKGPSFIIDTVNKSAIEAWGKSYEELVNKPFFEVFPEFEDGFNTIFKNIYTTGESFTNNEIEFLLKRPGKPDSAYFNLLFQPLRDLDNKIYAIMLIGTEVTEAVNTRKVLEASELFNRTILESNPDCLKILDVEGRMQYMNFNGLCQMEIDDFSTVKNKKWWILWGSENEALVRASIDKALKGETAQFIALNHTAKGTSKWWDVIVSPVGKPGEPVQQIISISRDITEKKKSEEAVEKMARHLKLATDSAKVGIWSLDIVSSQLEWTNIHKIMWGYEENSENLTYEDWHRVIVPEDKALAFQKIEESRVNHGVYAVEYRINRANDNLVRSIRSVGKYYYNDSGEAITLTGISVDITAQKEAEEKIRLSEKHFRTLTETIPQLIWITNEKGEFEYASRQWMEYSGHDPNVENSWEQLVYAEDLEEMMKTWEKSLITGMPYQAEVRLRNKQGEYLWHLAHGIASISEENRIIKWITTFTGIHQQKVNEQQKDEFISIASHEMKTPLTTAKGYLELLLSELDEENQTAFLYANKANQATERLHNLVKELLDVSKIQNGKLDYNVTSFDFNKLLDETIEDIQLTTKNHKLKKSGTILRPISGDKDRLQQVLINLLSNAIKYSPNADKVFIRVEQQPGKIQVSVQDFGIGMSNEHLHKIFDRYYRVQEHAVHFQGLGIGLHITNNIIKRHEGKMWAESEPNKGSIFYFALPF